MRLEHLLEVRLLFVHFNSFNDISSVFWLNVGKMFVVVFFEFQGLLRHLSELGKVYYMLYYIESKSKSSCQ